MSDRTRILLWQTSLGLALRMASVAATIVAMPLALDLLGPVAMGVWLVLLSMFQWITLFDLGIGAGARNEMGRAAASGDADWLRRSVATGWFYAAATSALLAVVLAALLATPAVDRFSREAFAGAPIGAGLWILVSGACMTLALNHVQTVFAALQRSAMQSAFALLSNVAFVLLLLAGRRLGASSVAAIAMLYVIAMLCACGVTLALFRWQHPALWPRRAAIDPALRSRILSGGARLFVIQLCALAIFTTDRVLVSAFVSPAAVVGYDAAFRIFALVTLVHGLLMSSAWSSFTQAHERGEWAWIRTTMKRLAWMTLPIAIVSAALAAVAGAIVRVWLGPAQVGSELLYAAFALATVMGCWSNVFSYFLSAIGDTHAQIRTALLAACINVPAAYLFAVILKFGAAGVVMGTCSAMLVFSVVGPIVSLRRLSAPGGAAPRQNMGTSA